MSRLITALVVPLLAWGALAAGSTAFLWFVTVLAACAYLDLAGVLARVAARPVVLVGLIPVVWLPSALAREPARGWDLVGDVFALALVLTFLVVLALGRRRDVSLVVGFTLLPALLVGLGSAALVLLSQRPDGFRWVIGVAVLAAIGRGGPLAARAAGSRAGRRASAPVREPAASDLAGFLGAAALVAVAALVLHLMADPPFTRLVAASVALIVLVLGLVANEVAQTVRAASAAGEQRRPLVAGTVYEASDALLVAAPAVYILSRALLS